MSVMVARQMGHAKFEESLDPQTMRGLLRHPGSWVAAQGATVLAVAEDPAKALRQARAKGVEEPLLFRVPDSSVCLY